MYFNEQILKTEKIALDQMDLRVDWKRAQARILAEQMTENFTGKMFVVFHSKLMREAVHKYEVKTFWEKLKNRCCCVKKELKLKVVEPPLPGDIIWENLHVTAFDRLLR